MYRIRRQHPICVRSVTVCHISCTLIGEDCGSDGKALEPSTICGRSSSSSPRLASIRPVGPVHSQPRISSPFCSTLMTRTFALPSTTFSTPFHSAARRLGECSS